MNNIDKIKVTLSDMQPVKKEKKQPKKVEKKKKERVVLTKEEKDAAKQAFYEAHKEEVDAYRAAYASAEGAKKLEVILDYKLTKPSMRAFIWKMATRIADGLTIIEDEVVEGKHFFDHFKFEDMQVGQKAYTCQGFRRQYFGEEGFAALKEFASSDYYRKNKKDKVAAANVHISKESVKKLEEAGLL